jgi:hypothetical protein
MQKATMKTLMTPSVWYIKQVEMTKFKKFVPEIDRADPIYRMPNNSVIKTIKEQNNQKVHERANKNKKQKSNLKRRIVRRRIIMGRIVRRRNVRKVKYEYEYQYIVLINLCDFNSCVVEEI